MSRCPRSAGYPRADTWCSVSAVPGTASLAGRGLLWIAFRNGRRRAVASWPSVGRPPRASARWRVSRLSVPSPLSDIDLGRLSRTVLQLRPAQVRQRVRLRAQRMALDHSVPLAGRWLLSGQDPAAGAGWPGGFTPLDARLWCGGEHGIALRAGELHL